MTEQKEELDMTNHELKELIRDKDDIIAHKEHIITELKSRTELMCQEFNDMLNTTLKLMKEHMSSKLNQEQDIKEQIQQQHAGLTQRLQVSLVC